MIRKFRVGARSLLMMAALLSLSACQESKPSSRSNREIDTAEIELLQKQWIPVQKAILRGHPQEALETIQRHPEWLKSSRFRNLILGPAMRRNAMPILELVIQHFDHLPIELGEFVMLPGHESLLLKLRERGFDPTMNDILSDAARRGNLEQLDQLLKRGETRGATEALTRVSLTIEDEELAEKWVHRLHSVGGECDGALLNAVKTQSPRRVRLLLKLGANPNIKDYKGLSAVHHSRLRVNRELNDSGKMSEDSQEVFRLLDKSFRNLPRAN